MYAYTEEKQRGEVLRARTFAPISQITPFADAPKDSASTHHIRTSHILLQVYPYSIEGTALAYDG